MLDDDERLLVDELLFGRGRPAKAPLGQRVNKIGGEDRCTAWWYDLSAFLRSLITYYQRLIATATEVGLSEQIRRTFPHCRVRPVIGSAGEVADFVWYDTVPNAAKVLPGIATCRLDASEPQEVLDDLDQGWRIRLTAWRGRIGLIEWDGEETVLPPTAAVSLDATELTRHAEAALSRLIGIYRDLIEALGRDFWS